MRERNHSKLVAIAVLFSATVLFCFLSNSLDIIGRITNIARKAESYPVIRVAMTICGNRLEEALTAIKSIILFRGTITPGSPALSFHVFVDDHVRKIFFEQLYRWPRSMRSKFNVTLYPVRFPETVSDRVHGTSQFKSMFRLCASQRLFLQDLLTDLDAVIYTDTDVVFLRPIDELWHSFGTFNESNVVAMSLSADTGSSWYTRGGSPNIPFVPPFGINDGLMLMNLTRMRKICWTSEMKLFSEIYKSNLRLGDQDLLNAYFRFNSDQLLILPCQWNYCECRCVVNISSFANSSVRDLCLSAHRDGIAVVHGNDGAFHINRQGRGFCFEIYKTILNFRVNDDSLQDVKRQHGRCINPATGM